LVVLLNNVEFRTVLLLPPAADVTADKDGFTEPPCDIVVVIGKTYEIGETM